jgi:hypothetical protein
VSVDHRAHIDAKRIAEYDIGGLARDAPEGK